jgi:hypothetical protein
VVVLDGLVSVAFTLASAGYFIAAMATDGDRHDKNLTFGLLFFIRHGSQCAIVTSNGRARTAAWIAAVSVIAVHPHDVGRETGGSSAARSTPSSATRPPAATR